MTGRFLLTIVLSLCELVLVFLLMCLFTEKIFPG